MPKCCIISKEAKVVTAVNISFLKMYVVVTATGVYVSAVEYIILLAVHTWEIDCCLDDAAGKCVLKCSSSRGVKMFSWEPGVTQSLLCVRDGFFKKCLPVMLFIVCTNAPTSGRSFNVLIEKAFKESLGTNLQKKCYWKCFYDTLFSWFLRKKYCLQVFYNDVNSVLIGHD